MKTNNEKNKSNSKERQLAHYQAYGKLKEMPTILDEITNEDDAGFIKVDAVIIKTVNNMQFVQAVAGKHVYDIKAGYMANTLISLAPVMEYPFEMHWHERDGKNVIM